LCITAKWAAYVGGGSKPEFASEQPNHSSPKEAKTFATNLPQPESCTATIVVHGSNDLLDHLIGAAEKHGWQVEADCLSSDQVEDHFELGWLLDREVGGLHAA
jgi:hypothetical protein